jgi:hypothetical protein
VAPLAAAFLTVDTKAKIRDGEGDVRPKPRRRRDAGDICQLRVELWAGVRVAAAMVDNPDTPPELKLRAVSALATAASVYAKLLTPEPQPPTEAPETPADVIVIRSSTGSNGHHA